MIAGQKRCIRANGADRVVEIDTPAHARVAAEYLGQKPTGGWGASYIENTTSLLCGIVGKGWHRKRIFRAE